MKSEKNKKEKRKYEGKPDGSAGGEEKWNAKESEK